MSFRLRVTLLATLAVALAAVGAAALMYVVVQQELTSQLDATLVDAARGGERIGPRGGPPFPRGPGQLLSGRPDIFAQVIDQSGTLVQADGPTSIPALITPEARAVAARARDPYFFDVTVNGSHLRVYVTRFREAQALEVTRSLDEIDSVLADTRLRLALVALGGALLAATLGMLVAHGALGPVRHLTTLVEDVRRTRDLTRRVAVERTDELGRLATSFNAMLEALDASIRSQRQLVADASHELRTPLTSLRTNLELLARGQPNDPVERQEVLVDLVSQMERLSHLVSDLIDLGRDEGAQLPVEEVRLDDLVAETVDFVGPRYPQARFVLHRTPTTVPGVRSRIARAVTNLLDNAGKWSPSNGLVEIDVADGEVSVRDHGPGITAEDAPHVFDRFWRAANARQLPGSGLGLAIVKDVAETHGGSVRLERPADGTGALFRLRLAR